MTLKTTNGKTAGQLRDEIRALVGQYFDVALAPQPFVAGLGSVPVSGKVFDSSEIELLVESSLDAWLTTGRFAAQFEREFAQFMGVRCASLVNSGSSANLVALSCLTSPSLGDRRLCPGDEVITVAAGFPTTVNPIIQNGLVPVFVDVQLPTYDVDVTQLEAAVSNRTKAIMLAHTLGNPFDLDAVRAFAAKHNLWLIEDCCDAVGSLYNGRTVGTFGAFATTSFYPAHHITMGEGGCVLTQSPALKKLAESFRDWGRDCWCDPGKSNTCGCRFEWKLGGLPSGYDHKYIYSHIGYNLKATDMQAAVGVAQLKKLPGFITARRANFTKLHTALSDLHDIFILPKATEQFGPELVRLSVRGAQGQRCAGNPQPDHAFSGITKHRHTSAVRRQLASPARLSRHRTARDRRFNKHRLCHEQRFLDRPLPRYHASDDRLHGRDFSPDSESRRRQAGSIGNI